MAATQAYLFSYDLYERRNIPELCAIMYREIKEFLIEAFCKWKGIKTSVYAILGEVCKYIGDMIRGTSMYKKWEKKIPLADWVTKFGQWLAGDDRAMLEEAMQ